LFKNHSEFWLLQLLFIALETRVFSCKNVFPFFCFIIVNYAPSKGRIQLEPEFGKYLSAPTHLCDYYIKQEFLMKLCLQGQKFPAPTPFTPSQSKVIFVLRSPGCLTAGRNRHTFFVSF